MDLVVRHTMNMRRHLIITAAVAAIAATACGDDDAIIDHDPVSSSNDPTPSSTTVTPTTNPPSDSSPSSTTDAGSDIDPCDHLTTDEVSDLLGDPTDPGVAGGITNFDGLDGKDEPALEECYWSVTEPGTGGMDGRHLTLELAVGRGDDAVAVFEDARNDGWTFSVSAASDTVGDVSLVGRQDAHFAGVLIRADDVVLQCDMTNYSTSALPKSTEDLCREALGTTLAHLDLE